jgi:hypothetical protein
MVQLFSEMRRGGRPSNGGRRKFSGLTPGIPVEVAVSGPTAVVGELMRSHKFAAPNVKAILLRTREFKGVESSYNQL